MSLFSHILSIGDTIVTRNDDDYPYDVVWITDEASLNLLENLKKEHDIEVITQECIYLTTPDFYEHIGISATEYENLTGEKVELLNYEVAVHYQRKRDERNSMGIDYGSRRPRIYVGSSAAELWIETGRGGIIPSAEFDTEYRIKESRQEIVFGAFAGGDNESIVVFADEVYERARQEEKDCGLVAALNISKNYEAVLHEISTYANENTVDIQRFYEKTTLKKADEINQLLYMAVYLISFIMTIGCSTFLIVIKIGNDAEEMEYKYQFYRQMGMSESMWARAAKLENSVGIVTAVFSGVLVGSIYIGNEVFLRKLNVEDVLAYGKLLAAAVAFILIVNGVSIIVGNCVLIRRVIGEQ